MELNLKNFWENKEIFLQRCLDSEVRRFPEFVDSFRKAKNPYKKIQHLVYTDFGMVCKYIFNIYDDAWNFDEGLAAVKLNGKWGFVDKLGDIAIPFIYEYVNSFREGLATVKLNDKFGMIDRNNKTIIPIIYTQMGGEHFKNGYEEVEVDGVFYIINIFNEITHKYNKEKDLYEFVYIPKITTIDI